MDEVVRSALASWSNFYVIIGSASGALIGLMFVAITLIGQSGHRSSGQSLAAFGTPTIANFIAPLVLAAIATAPWRQAAHVALVLGLTGGAWLAYLALTTWLARRQTDYELVLADWIWFSALPLIAYATLIGAALWLRSSPESALFVVGADAVLLLLIAIHNAWDTATYVAVTLQKQEG